MQRDATTSESACLAMHSVRLEHQTSALPEDPEHPEDHFALPAQVSDVVASGGGGIAVAY